MRKSRVTDSEREGRWREIFTRFQKGGLPFKKFCAQENISPNTFQYWRRELRKRDEARGLSSTISKGDNRPSDHQQKMDFWLRIIDEINLYKGSINSYCRNHGISSGSLHFWEKRLRELKLTNGVRRDELKMRKSGSRLVPAQTLDDAAAAEPAARYEKHIRAGIAGKSAESVKPTFVSLELSPEAVGTCQPKANRPNEAVLGADMLAAELAHARTGCQVRIFNGADRSTIMALIAALAACQPIEF